MASIIDVYYIIFYTIIIIYSLACIPHTAFCYGSNMCLPDSLFGE